MAAAKIGISTNTAPSALSHVRTEAISLSGTIWAASALALRLHSRMLIVGRIDSSPTSGERRDLCPEHPVIDVELPTLQAEEDATESDDDDQNGNYAHRPGQSRQGEKRIAGQTRTNKYGLCGENGDQPKISK